MSTQDLAGGAGQSDAPQGLRAGLRRLSALVQGEGERGLAQRGALLAFGIRVASAAIAYLSQVVLARWMGSFEYGVFVFVWVWVLILGGLAPLGLSTASIRFVPEYMEKRRLPLLRGLLLGSRLIAVAVSTGVMLAGLAALALFGDLVEHYYVLPAILILFCLPAYTLEDIQDGIARGKGWIDIALVPPYILRPLLILLAMVAAFALGLPMTAVTAASAAIIACWVAGVAQLIVLERRLRQTVPAGRRSYRTGVWLKTSLPMLLLHGFELVMQNTDVLVLSLYMTPSDVAIYFAALKTMGLIAFVHFAVSAAAASKFSAYNARGDRAELAAFVRQAVRWTFWPSL
ncbi:MAG: lipopolysaccharide biosynthesis protein, partial [Methyloligellaceae bacterium]